MSGSRPLSSSKPPSESGVQMKKTVFSIIMIAVLASMVLASEIAFVESYDAALGKASDSDQKILITFYSDT